MTIPDYDICDCGKRGTHAVCNPTDGKQELSCYFGLSYASWLTLPRVMMEAMPEEWQGAMAKLLVQFDETFPNQPDIGTRVLVTKNGKLIPTPNGMLNYRRPDKEMLAEMMGK